MKTLSLTIWVISFLISTSHHQPRAKSNAFILKGEIVGSNTEYLILSYTESSNVYVSDTLPINNNYFSAEGYLMSTQMVSLTSNITGRYMEDPNRLRFFLEPNEVQIAITEGEFSKAKISGSKTQVEKESLDKKVKPYYEKIEAIRVERDKLKNEKERTDHKNLEPEIEKLTAKWQRILDEVKEVRLQYVLNNPSSYLSIDVLDFYKGTLPTDSVKMLYETLDPLLKDSNYGLKIQEQINLHIVNTGDVAPNFYREDSEGNVLSLNQFKGKTVLLDFGAGWCVPCKKEIPEIKRIYDKYHSKGLEIIGVSNDYDKISWKEYIEKEKLTWHHIYEGIMQLKTEGSISNLYYVQPIPAYILIDKNGIIIDRYRGADERIRA